MNKNVDLMHTKIRRFFFVCFCKFLNAPKQYKNLPMFLHVQSSCMKAGSTHPPPRCAGSSLTSWRCAWCAWRWTHAAAKTATAASHNLRCCPCTKQSLGSFDCCFGEHLRRMSVYRRLMQGMKAVAGNRSRRSRRRMMWRQAMAGCGCTRGVPCPASKLAVQKDFNLKIESVSVLGGVEVQVYFLCTKYHSPLHCFQYFCLKKRKLKSISNAAIIINQIGRYILNLTIILDKRQTVNKPHFPITNGRTDTVLS